MKKIILVALLFVAVILVGLIAVSTSNNGYAASIKEVRTAPFAGSNSATLHGESIDDDAIIESIWGKIWGAIKRVSRAVNDFMCDYLPEYWPSVLC